MPILSPTTRIYLCENAGITKDHKAYFSSNSAMISYLQGKVSHSFTNCTYQRADEREYTQLNIDYYDALKCDVMFWQNPNNSTKYLVALITGFEYLNEGTTRIYFEIDPYSSFCGDIEWQPCYVEREHVTGDWVDGQPNWNNCGISEPISGAPVVVENELTYPLVPTRYVILTPYNEDGQISIHGNTLGGIYSGMNMIVKNTAEEVDDYLNTVAVHIATTLDNIGPILSVPAFFLNDKEWEMGTLQSPWITLNGHFNNAKVYTSQYTMLRVEGAAGRQKEFLPELMGQNGLATPLTQLFAKGGLIGGIGGFAVYLKNYKGIETSLEDAYLITDMPSGVWVGNNLLDNWQNAIMKTISGGLKGAAAGSVAGPGGTALGALGGAALSLVGMADQMVASGGQVNTTANAAVAFGAYRVCTRWYISPTQIMEAVDDFFDRFGYAVGLLKIPNVNTRPIWNYVKTSEAHIGGDIPEHYREQICDMLNNGVTFWNVNRRSIGDFSNPSANQIENYTYDDFLEDPPFQEYDPPEPDPEQPDPPAADDFSVLPDEVVEYSLAADGDTYLSKNFKVREFRCHDGSDKILVSKRLVELLQIIRDHYGVQVIINSGYRTASHNAAVGGAAKSQHLYGRAADIVVSAQTPLNVYNWIANNVMPSGKGGMGCYRSQGFVHVDVRPSGYWRDNNV